MSNRSTSMLWVSTSRVCRRHNTISWWWLPEHVVCLNLSKTPCQTPNFPNSISDYILHITNTFPYTQMQHMCAQVGATRPATTSAMWRCRLLCCEGEHVVMAASTGVTPTIFLPSLSQLWYRFANIAVHTGVYFDRCATIEILKCFA